MQVEFRIVLSFSRECRKSNHGGVFRFLHGDVVLIAEQYHVVFALVSVLPKHVLRLAVGESFVTVVKYEMQVSVRILRDVF